MIFVTLSNQSYCFNNVEVDPRRIPLGTKGRMKMRYRCHGHKVVFPEQPLMHPDFMTNGKYSDSVQQMLDEIDVGDKYEKTSLTMRFDTPIVPLTVSVAPDDRRIWGVHRYHSMRRPGLSPFIERAVSSDELGYVSIQILRLRNSVMLIRAYGGQEVRALPWMKPKDPDVALRYWRENAFLARGHYMIRPSTTRPVAPDWYCPVSANN